MNPSLPANLKEAEREIQLALINYLSTIDDNNLLLSINLKFDGLRLNPIIYRLSEALNNKHYKIKVVFTDAGATALAKRDMTNISDKILSLSELKKIDYNIEDHKTILVSPQPYDAEELEIICTTLKSSYIMVNGKLEDPLVGVGHIGRERRKRFNNLWKQIYYLEPLSKGAIKFEYPNEWQLFKLQADGYIFNKSFRSKPDEETIIMNL